MPEVGRGRIESGTGDVSFTNANTAGSPTTRQSNATSVSDLTVRSVNGNNLGSGSPLFRGSNGIEHIVLDFKTLLAGDGIDFEEGADTLRLNARFSGSLEDSGVSEGTYVAPILVINKKGIITSATPTQVITEIVPMAGTGIVVVERDGTTLRARRIRGEANSGLTTANIGGDIVIGLTGVARAVVGTSGVSVTQSLGTYTVGLQTTGVTAGTYAYATVTVDSFGRLTAVTPGSVTGSVLLGTGSGAPVGSFERIDIPGATITPNGATATLVLPAAPIQNIVNRPGSGAALLASLSNATASLRRVIGSGGINITEGPDEVTIDGSGTRLTVQNGPTNLGQFPILRFAGAGVIATDAAGGVALITIPGETVSNYLNLGATDLNTAQVFESVQSNTARFRRVVGVGGIVINQNATDIFIDGSNISGGGSGVGSLSNLGSTGGNSGQVFESTQGGVARLRRIVGTGGLAISQNTTDIVIDGSAVAASGQVGVGLQGNSIGSFSSLMFSGNGVASITPSGGTAVITTISSDGQNIGSSGAGVFESMAGATLRFRRLRGAGGVTVSQGLTDILIDASAVLAGGVTASSLSSERNFALVGAVTGSALSDLATGVTITTSLSTTGVVAGTYVSADIVVGADGRIYAVSSGSGGITSSAITAALGFMPYNPTQAGSVAGLFTVNGNATVTGTLTATALNGNAATASALNAARVFALSGDVTGSVSSNLSTGYTLAASLSNIGTAGSYAFATITTDSKGRVTAASSNTPTNRGSGFEVYVAGSPLQFRTIRSGGNVNISATADEIVISAGSIAAGGGLVISNLGLLNINTAHFYDEESPDGAAQFRRLNGSADVLVQQQSGDVLLSLADTGVAAATYVLPTMVVDSKGRVRTASSASFGAGLAFANGSLGLTPTGVTAGSYQYASVDVGADGRVIFATTGVAPVTSVSAVGGNGVTIIGSPITSTGTFTVALTPTGVMPDIYENATVQVDQFGRIIDITQGDAPTTTLIGDATGVGTGTVPVVLAPSGVTAGTYGFARFVVDSKGRITSAVSDALTIAAGSGIAVSGSPLASAGTLGIALQASGVTAGTYTNPTITVDDFGRVLLAVNGAAPGGGGSLTGIIMQGSADITVTPSGTEATSFALSLATNGVTAGTYERVVVDSRGRVTNGSNPGFITGNQTITLSGDATGSGGTAIALTLASTGVLAGTYSFATVSVDAKGRVTSAASASLPPAVTRIVVTSGNDIEVFGDTTITSQGTFHVRLRESFGEPGQYNTVTVSETGLVIEATNIPYLQTAVTTVAISAGAGITTSGGPITTAGTLTVGLATSGVLAGTYAFATVTVDEFGRVTSAAGNTAVQSVAAVGSSGVTVTGGPITTTGTLSVALQPSGVSAGTYSLSTIVVDALGRVTSASAGIGGGVTSVSANGLNGINVSGGPITSTGTLAISLNDTGVTAGAYSLPNLTVDAQGRVTAISSRALVNLGSAAPVMVASAGTLAFKTIRAGSNVTITESANEVTINGAGAAGNVYNIRINFATNGSTPVDTTNIVPNSGNPGALPSGWSVTATTTAVTFTVPSGTFMPPNIPIVTIAGRTSAGGYSVRTISNATGLPTCTVTDTTMVIGSITGTNTGANATSDNHIWLRITV